MKHLILIVFLVQILPASALEVVGIYTGEQNLTVEQIETSRLFQQHPSNVIREGITNRAVFLKLSITADRNDTILYLTNPSLEYIELFDTNRTLKDTGGIFLHPRLRQHPHGPDQQTAQNARQTFHPDRPQGRLPAGSQPEMTDRLLDCKVFAR